MTLQRGSGVSLYAQVKQELLSRIDGQHWLPGQMIPTEQQLSLEFGVSRNTIRQAVGDLVNAGLVVRYAGRGTFVVATKITDATFRAGQLLEQRYGFSAHAQVLEVAEFPAGSPKIPVSLDVPPDMKMLKVRRLVSMEVEPFVLTSTCLVIRRDTTVGDDDLARYVLPALSSKHGAGPLVRTERTFEAVMAQPDEMELLGMTEPLPLLLVRSIGRTSSGQRVTTTNSLFRGDRYRYSTTSENEQIIGP
ncbi:GntR family transcriptional regulator [Actinophytocola sp.]|uniref:GntR family transcriptional regulator n=1 Tax=Actinophytocola sp. TaxID=1872138 RepID=UPI003D6AED07